MFEERTLGYALARSLFVFPFLALALLLIVLSGAHRSLSPDLLLSSYAVPGEGEPLRFCRSRRGSFPLHIVLSGLLLFDQIPHPRLAIPPLSSFTRRDDIFVAYSVHHSAVTNRSCSAGSSTAEPPKDELLGDLLSIAFDGASCLSRHQSAWYRRKPSNHTPSPYLIRRLRRYEALHKKCGPNTELYRKAVEQLVSDTGTAAAECNYVVWVPSDGLGNRIISIASAFLYALLNDKVLLLYLTDDMGDLFCEPFPETSWVLPSDFPVRYSWVLEKDHGYGNLLKNKLLSNDMDTANASLPAFLYLHLVHSNDEFDKMFYCEEGQQLLRKFSWLLLRSNQYFAPAFFLVPEFDMELSLLFPEKTAVFHHLGTYLFHPSNTVWGYITRYYEAYLANAKSRLGIQIRLFGKADFDSHSDYIIDCALTKRLLPNVNLTDTALPTITGAKPRSVLVTSLRSGYFEKLTNMYYEHATTTGEVISVHQPSHEEEQHSEKLNHNMKAFAEIYLLSLSDALITSPFSTFGYVAQGLGGLRPWLLVRPDDHDLCLHSMSMEPCFHFPPSYDCKARKKVDIGSVAPYLRHCEDFPRGVRLFD
ncbi:unnamed protein product [Musa hybrid cultivar]